MKLVTSKNAIIDKYLETCKLRALTGDSLTELPFHRVSWAQHIVTFLYSKCLLY